MAGITVKNGLKAKPTHRAITRLLTTRSLKKSELFITLFSFSVVDFQNIYLSLLQL
jgi:hypothetical protein